MTTWGAISSPGLGTGEVPRRYAQRTYLRRRISGEPTSDDIPLGAWAEKPSNSELWDIVKSASEEA